MARGNTNTTLLATLQHKYDCPLGFESNDTSWDTLPMPAPPPKKTQYRNNATLATVCMTLVSFLHHLAPVVCHGDVYRCHTSLAVIVGNRRSDVCGAGWYGFQRPKSNFLFSHACVVVPWYTYEWPPQVFNPKTLQLSTCHLHCLHNQHLLQMPMLAWWQPTTT